MPRSIFLLFACLCTCCNGDGAIHVSGEVRGGVERILILDPDGDVIASAEPEGGGFAFDLSGSDSEVVLVAEGKDGAKVVSAGFEPGSHRNLPPLRMWPAKVKCRKRGDGYEFSWERLEGHSYQEPVSYSLLITYPKSVGGKGELALNTGLKTLAKMKVDELNESMPGRSVDGLELTIVVRAFGKGSVDYVYWGAPLEYTLPPDFPPPPDSEAAVSGDR